MIYYVSLSPSGMQAPPNLWQAVLVLPPHGRCNFCEYSV